MKNAVARRLVSKSLTTPPICSIITAHLKAYSNFGLKGGEAFNGHIFGVKISSLALTSKVCDGFSYVLQTDLLLSLR